MKQVLNKTWLALTGSVLTIAAWAQEKKLDVDINVDKGGNWYQQPWVWVVGGAVFILVLVALAKGGKNTN